MSNVRKIMCHAEFPCPKCGKSFLSMALAPWDDERGIVGDAVQCGHVDGCNECSRAERDADDAERAKSRQQRAWAKKAETLKMPQPGRRR